MAITIEKFTFNGFQENTYVLHDGSHCVIIDPGCYTSDEQTVLFSFIEENNLEPSAVLLTHAHIDHVLGCAAVLNRYSIDFYIHEGDLTTLSSVPNYAHLYGFPGYTPPSEPTHILKGGETLTFGSMTFNVIFAPGHAPGHVVYYNEEQSFVINGDVLFNGSFGRTDLPGGSLEVLKKSIKEQLFTLPDNTRVYCGHGPETFIGQEKQTNAILSF